MAPSLPRRVRPRHRARGPGLRPAVTVAAAGCLAGLLVALAGTTGVAARSAAGPAVPSGSGAVGPFAEPAAAAAVLARWDRARANAWAAGDVAALRDLYVGAAGSGDVRLLGRYADRGYRVPGLRHQLLALEVLRREPGVWWLRVTDRLAGGVAVRGRERVSLPRDRASIHRVLLLRGQDGRWRVARVVPG